MANEQTVNRSPIILVVDSDKDAYKAIYRSLLHSGYKPEYAHDSEAALEILNRLPVRLIIADLEFQQEGQQSITPSLRRSYPDIPVLVSSDQLSVDTVVAAVKNGAADFIAKPIKTDVLLKVIKEYLPSEPCGERLIAVDPLSLKIKGLATRVSQTDATVLITGPSGVGKEVFSQFIHSRSGRADKPFVAVNCAAIPENMLEAMLFGYEKGAYTGAVSNHIGKFEQAQGGTLLLDEISEMDLGLQAKLLRVLQERELERLGGRRTIRLDVRVIATTNRDLRQAVKNGEFREDLFYRLNVFPLNVPALKDRPMDILPLANHFLAQGGDTQVSMLSSEAEQKLLRHSWPGNVRELDNVIQRALILQSDRLIGADDIQFEMIEPAQQAVLEEITRTDESLSSWMREQERQQIQNAIRQGGSKKEAAAILGISPRTLRYKMARLRQENGREEQSRKEQFVG